MPLPANSSISLQGPSRPGESTTATPNAAMIVRMTEETLDALSGLSGADRVDFEFGDKPGIYVHDRFFPMRYDREKDNQELFIRTTQPNRSNAPLRLNANIVGKFAVEKVLSEKISQQLRTSAALAAKQKAERKAILVDSPPVTTPVTQKAASKKKVPPKSTPVSTPTIVKSYATSPRETPTASASSASLPPETATMYRQRLIHYLALGAATVQNIFKEFGGSDIDHNTRAWIMDLLFEVAEQEQLPRKVASTPQATTWRLKPKTWLEVRPYQYSGYTENVRVKVARSGRTVLGDLKISETDPAWDHVKFRRESGHGSASANAQTAQRVINGTSSAAAKAKAKAKQDKLDKGTGVEVKKRPEAAPSTRPTHATASLPTRPNPSPSPERSGTPVRTLKGKERETDTEKEEGELSASQTPPRITTAPTTERRPAGSRPNGVSASTMPPPPVPISSQASTSSQLSSSMALKRPSGPVDVRGPKRPPPDPSERARAAPPIPPPASVDRKPVVNIVKKEVVKQTKKERVSLHEGGTAAAITTSSKQAAKERELARRERERDKESDRESVRMARKERDSDRESVRIARKERDSDIESIRIPRKERERDSDMESIRIPRKDRERESDRDSIRGRTKEKAAKERDYVKERDYERPREKVKEQASSSSRPVVKSTTKRKISQSSDEESSDWGIEEEQLQRMKAAAKLKRQREWERERERESTPPVKSSLKAIRRESPPPKQKIKREASPLPLTKTVKPTIERRITTGSSSTTTKIAKKAREESMSRSLSVKSHKRRRSIDFTSSSESEEDEPKPKASKSTSSKVISSMVSKNPVSVTAHSVVSSTKPRPTLSKRDQLRAKYSNKYSEYILVFQKLVAQKSKVAKVAARLRHGSESASGDSDLDVDLMPLDKLEELTARHQRLYDELEEIKRSYMA